MTNHKASWKLYSSRRKITLESLIQQGKVTDYATYTDYCVKMHVEPMPESEFGRQTVGLLQVKPSATPAPSPAPAPQAPPEESGVEATVWLAGVQQEAESPAPIDDRRPSKKKRTSDPQQGES